MSMLRSSDSLQTWVRRCVSAAVNATNVDENQWCNTLACSMASWPNLSAAVRVRNANDEVVAVGASLDVDTEARDALIELMSRPEGVRPGVDLRACAGFHSARVSGDLCVFLTGDIDAFEEHIVPATTAFAELFRAQVAEPAARREAILARLRPSQRPLLPLLTTGMSQRDISHVLGKSPHTVHDHTKMIYRTLKVHSRVELAAVWHGFPIETPDPV